VVVVAGRNAVSLAELAAAAEQEQVKLFYAQV
jgi:hypothetical protein